MIVSVLKRYRMLQFAIALLAAWPASTLAQDLVTTRNISLALASESATAAIAQCLKDGFRATVTVVDSGGQIKAVMRADGAGPHTVDSSRPFCVNAVHRRSVCASWNKCYRFQVGSRSVLATKWSGLSAWAALREARRTSAVPAPESRQSRAV